MFVHGVDMEFGRARTLSDTFGPVGNRQIVAENDGEQVNLGWKSLLAHTSRNTLQGSTHSPKQMSPSAHAESATNMQSRNIFESTVAKN